MFIMTSTRVHAFCTGCSPCDYGSVLFHRLLCSHCHISRLFRPFSTGCFVMSFYCSLTFSIKWLANICSLVETIKNRVNISCNWFNYKNTLNIFLFFHSFVCHFIEVWHHLYFHMLQVWLLSTNQWYSIYGVQICFWLYFFFLFLVIRSKIRFDNFIDFKSSIFFFFFSLCLIWIILMVLCKKFLNFYIYWWLLFWK